jgi:hypothetical protein
MDDWRLYAHPALQLQWRYPAATPGGHPVELIEEQRDDYLRVHLLAPDDEVYFEVRRFAEGDPQAHHARHRAGLEAQLAGQGLTVSDLTPAPVAGRAGHAYQFQWGERERAARLLVVGGGLYRIIYNPRSALNDQILSTMSAP